MFNLIALLAIAAVCPNPEMINTSKEPWNARDNREFNFALYLESCKREHPCTPCMAKFIKKKPLVYHVVCGPERKSGL